MLLTTIPFKGEKEEKRETKEERERESAQLVLVDNVLREIGTGSGEEARKRDK